METERSAEALTDFLRAVRQTPDPYQSTRVAKALRRVAVRDLDRVVLHQLVTAHSALYNVPRETGPPTQKWRPARFQLLGAALFNLRPDARSACLLGCISYATGQHQASIAQLNHGIELTNNGVIGSWLYLNCGAALDATGQLRDAIDAYEASSRVAEQSNHVASQLFSLFASLRLGLSRDSDRTIRKIFDSDGGVVNAELDKISRMYQARDVARRADCLQPIRPQLRALGSRGRYLDRALASTYY